MFVCPDILNIADIPTIPEIPIIIQISSRLPFQKGITLDVCPDISKNFNIPDTTNIPTVPKIPIIIVLSSSF